MRRTLQIALLTLMSVLAGQVPAQELNATVEINCTPKEAAYSVRCLKD